MPVVRATLALIGLSACLFATLAAGPAEASSPRTKAMYVYELPDGSRIVTDFALNNRHYRLVRTGADTRGVGQLAASNTSQFFRTDPGAYDGLIRRIASEHGVEFALVKAVMHVESSFNPYARSPKGALGLMQVLPETARRHGVHDVYDPEQNIEAGVRHLKYLLGLFNHKHYLVLAAYNAGENAVRNHRGIPPYQETQRYVRQVLKMKREYARS
jgi:soluble lytic murein transglycosylase-like protein